MGLNNKGFAISAVVYSALVLFLLVISSSLFALSSRGKQLEKATESVKKTFAYSEITLNKTLTSNDFYITEYRGKYKIVTPEGTGYILLPRNILIVRSSNGSNVGVKFESMDNEPIYFSTYQNNSKYKFLEINTDEIGTDVVIKVVYTNEVN